MFAVDGLKMNSVDYIVIVNRDFSVVYNGRFDEKVRLDQVTDPKKGFEVKSFFEMYPEVDRENSSVVESMSTGRMTVRKFQKFTDCWGGSYCAHNITIPIVHNGEVSGVVELSKDVTSLGAAEEDLEKATREFDLDVEAIRREMEIITFESILTVSEELRDTIRKARILARLPNPTLIYGQTGTGKELFAQAMINDSGLPRDKVVIQNCAAVPEGLMESILFGAVKGAYTGAETHKGLFEQADGGILFLDELSSMPYHVQGQLLRVLQDGSYRPVGSGAEKRAAVKIIGAMNVDPIRAIEEKKLRSDLFYRFTSSMITLPALRERREDIGFYVDHYIKQFNRIYNRRVQGISDELQDFLYCYDWPGNVRELKHLVEAIVSFSGKEILTMKDLPPYMKEVMKASDRPGEKQDAGGAKSSAGETMTMDELFSRVVDCFQSQEQPDINFFFKEAERRCVKEALKRAGGNKTKAAALLGLPRPTLIYRIESLGALDED